MIYHVNNAFNKVYTSSLQGKRDIKFGKVSTGLHYNIPQLQRIGKDSKGIYENAPVTVYELEETDIELMSRLLVDSNWNKSRFGGQIIKNFINKISKKEKPSFFLLELDSSGLEPEKRVKCLAKTTNIHIPTEKRNIFDIDFIQVASDSLKTSPNPREVKKAGEKMLYSLVKLAYDQGFQRVQLFSKNDPFYDAYDIRPMVNEFPTYIDCCIDTSHREMNRKEMKGFLRKYKFTVPVK